MLVDLCLEFLLDTSQMFLHFPSFDFSCSFLVNSFFNNLLCNFFLDLFKLDGLFLL